MNIHLVIECWGDRPGDHGYQAFKDRKQAEKVWERLIHEYLDGSDRDADDEIKTCKEQDFVFHHSDGFIAIETVTLKETKK